MSTHVRPIYVRKYHGQILSNCTATVLPAKSESDVLFCLQSHQGLIIDRSLVYQSYPVDRIDTQVIYQFALSKVECTQKCS